MNETKGEAHPGFYAGVEPQLRSSLTLSHDEQLHPTSAGCRLFEGGFCKGRASTYDVMMAKMMKMSSMKMGMKKMAMKKVSPSIIARGKRARLAVWRGKAQKTGGGLTKADLKKNKKGKIVALKHSVGTKKKAQWKGCANPWSQAVGKARKAMGVDGFLAVGGKSAAGKQLLAKVRALYKK
eukprot:g14246.t1